MESSITVKAKLKNFFLKRNRKRSFTRLNQIERELRKNGMVKYKNPVRLDVCRDLLVNIPEDIQEKMQNQEADEEIEERERYYFGDLTTTEKKKAFRKYRKVLYEETICEICGKYPEEVWEYMLSKEALYSTRSDQFRVQEGIIEFLTIFIVLLIIVKGIEKILLLWS